MKSKQLTRRNIYDDYTDPRKPLWPHFAGMLLPLSVGGLGLFFALSSMAAYADSATTEGVVVALKVQSDRDGSYSMAVAAYTVGTTRYRCEGSVWWSGWVYRVGDRVKICYKIGDPGTAVIDSFGERWLTAVVFLALGLFIEGYLLKVLLKHICNKRAVAAKMKRRALEKK